MKRRAFGTMFCMALALAAGAAAPAPPPGTFRVQATQASTVQAAGPRRGTVGERYLNVEGSGKRGYASYAVLRFNVADLRRDMDERYGAGKYRVTSMTLVLTQCNAPFTRDGSVAVYFTPDTAAEISGPACRLRYPYDAKGSVLRGEELTRVRFAAPTQASGPTGKVDRYRIAAAPEAPSLFDAVMHAKVVTLVLCEGEQGVAATWAGMRPLRGFEPPTLQVEAVSTK